ncbi:NAD(P)/FAD-dependent oxidoreductase [Spongiimicrobium salis]|uniref:NAD(P)/FAD-dependent oxidoreductase n=1 Tax=Spongiimicrobium salis TaxID=1667022 RepID=UPI00374CF86F
MNLSYWEYKTWLSHLDFTIVGSGIVGLTTAIHLKKRFPKAKILILEKGILPQGASTKNAGFACFGSVSELLSDLKRHSEVEVLELVKKRYHGIEGLRELLGDEQLGYKRYGGHEVFRETDLEKYEHCWENMPMLNALLMPVFGRNAFSLRANTFGFEEVNTTYISNLHEAQIDTGKMMLGLLRLAQQQGVQVLNSVLVEDFAEGQDQVLLKTNQFELKTKKLLITTNGFAKQLLEQDCVPARAQVVLTQPIPNLHIKGTFHLDEGYYYFRNIDDRILLGGGRNLDLKTEETMEFGATPLVQDALEQLLKEVILPNTPHEIAMRWSGIMGVGPQKKPIIKQLSPNIACGIRMGGMGIAIGNAVGEQLAALH